MEIVTDKSFKYSLTGLGFESEEFNFIKDFFYLTTCPVGSFTTMYQVKNFSIYKVTENNQTKIEDDKRNNLMLLHGTKKTGATGILKTGFRNSERGWFGKGVYMTECSDVAFDYSNPNGSKLLSYIFVNEVLESEKLQTSTFDDDPWDMLNNKEDNTDERLNPFEKHIRPYSPQPKAEDYREDLLGGKYRNIKIDGLNQLDEFVADDKITIPRYLIVFEIENKN